MIKDLMLTWSRVVFLQEFFINQHHKYITFWICQAICSIWVTDSTTNDPSHLGWNFPFIFCVMTIGLLTVKTRLLFLKVRSLTFLLKALKFELDKARFSVELVGVCRPKLPAPGIAIDVSPYLSSQLSKQRAEMGSRSLVRVQFHSRTLKRMV